MDESGFTELKTPPEQGATAALGAVLLGPHKAPLVPPAIHAAQHERADHAGVRSAHSRRTLGDQLVVHLVDQGGA